MFQLSESVLLIFILQIFVLSLAIYSARKLYLWQIINKWDDVPLNEVSVRIAEQLQIENQISKVIYYYPVITYSYDFQSKTYSNTGGIFDYKSTWSTNLDSVQVLSNSILSRKTFKVNKLRPNEAFVLFILSDYRKNHFITILAVSAGLFITSIFLLLNS